MLILVTQILMFDTGYCVMMVISLQGVTAIKKSP